MNIKSGYLSIYEILRVTEIEIDKYVYYLSPLLLFGSGFFDKLRMTYCVLRTIEDCLRSFLPKLKKEPKQLLCPRFTVRSVTGLMAERKNSHQKMLRHVSVLHAIFTLRIYVHEANGITGKGYKVRMLYEKAVTFVTFLNFGLGEKYCYLVLSLFSFTK